MRLLITIAQVVQSNAATSVINIGTVRALATGALSQGGTKYDGLED
jgi:hypothetical protein